jgi:uncharacterized protein YdeI (YjbR/CyaY-like superfamily)
MKIGDEMQKYFDESLFLENSFLYLSKENKNSYRNYLH